MREHKISPRAKRMWERLSSWYGTRLTEQFGPTPPQDWCDVIDRAPDSAMVSVLAQIRDKHTTFPPTFPEFDALFAKTRPDADGSNGPSIAERLCEFALKHRDLSTCHIGGAWTYIPRTFAAPGADGKTRARHGVEITAVRIPGLEGFPDVIVTVADMELEQNA